MARLTLTVTESQEGRTVGAILRGELSMSTGCVNRLKRQERGICRNGSRVFTNAVVHRGDVLTVDISAGERPTDVEPIPMDLDIRYEDPYLLILNKPAGIAVIPSSLRPEEPTIANGMAAYLGDKSAFHPVNRLDRGTTGLMAVAKSGYIHERLQSRLHTEGFRRGYLAVTLGIPSPREGCVKLPIGRAEGSAVKRRIDPQGKPAETEYRLLRTVGGCSLVELWPLTGRTHQIRVHMAAIGCPLAGDWLYGEENLSLVKRPALHAAYLILNHPVTGEQLRLSAPLPHDIQMILER